MQGTTKGTWMLPMALVAAGAAIVAPAVNLAQTNTPNTENQEEDQVDDSKQPIVKKLGHVMVGVTDLERSLQFYRDALGLAVSHQGDGLAFLDAHGVIVGLSLELGKSQQQLAGTVELVFSVENVSAAFGALQAKGVTVVHTPRQATPTDWVANFRDPDGHLVSIFGPKGG